MGEIMNIPVIPKKNKKMPFVKMKIEPPLIVHPSTNKRIQSFDYAPHNKS